LAHEANDLFRIHLRAAIEPMAMEGGDVFIVEEFVMQNTAVGGGGTLRPPLRLRLGMSEGHSVVSCDDSRWHGAWNKIHGGWCIQFHFAGTGIEKTCVFKRIEGTNGYLQILEAPPHQNVLLPLRDREEQPHHSTLSTEPWIQVVTPRHVHNFP